MAKAGDYLKKFSYKKKEQISCGVLPVDVILNGGIKLGGCYGIASPPGGGKSTISLQICKALCDAGRFVCYVDIEQGVDEDQVKGAGLGNYLEPVNGEEWPRFNLVNDLYTYSQFQSFCRDLIDAKNAGTVNYEFIVADSLSGLVAENILQGDCEAATYAADARPLAKLIKSVRPPLGVAGVTLFNIVQAASNLNAGMYEPEWVAKLTKAIEHALDALIIIEHPQYNKYKIWGKKKTPNGEIDVEIGYYGKLYTTKSRKGLNRVKLEVPVIMGKGIDCAQFLQNTLIATGVFVKGTKYYKYMVDGVEQKLEGEENFKQFVADNYEMLVKMLYSLGYFDLTNDATVQQVAVIEPSEVAGAGVSQEELNNEPDGDDTFK